MPHHHLLNEYVLFGSATKVKYPFMCTSLNFLFLLFYSCASTVFTTIPDMLFLIFIRISPPNLLFYKNVLVILSPFYFQFSNFSLQICKSVTLGVSSKHLKFSIFYLPELEKPLYYFIFLIKSALSCGSGFISLLFQLIFILHPCVYGVIFNCILILYLKNCLQN